MAYLDNSRDWGARFAPSLAELESLARISFSHLPEKLRLLCGHVAIEIADFPEESVIEDMGLETPFELLSLYEGAGIGARFTFADKKEQEQNRIWLFRRPILDYWAENEETLDEILTYLLWHELSRPLGLSEEDREAAANAA